MEKIIADNLADSSLCTEDFLIGTMQNIVSTYKEDYCDKHIIPVIADPSEKITDNNLLSDYPVDDFTAFITNISKQLYLEKKMNRCPNETGSNVDPDSI